jgi:dienelactone hydrolase
LKPNNSEIKESLVRFGEDGRLNGMVTHPCNEKISRAGVILLNAGFLHKVGPNRIYVKIARKLSRENYTVLRFDFSGIGDSYSSLATQSHESRKNREIKNGIDFICSKYNLSKIVLIGFCSGADAALNYLGEDDRIIGTILINGYLADEKKLGEIYKFAQTHLQKRYYNSSIFKSDRLKRLFTGKSDYKAIVKLFTPKKIKNAGENDAFRKWNEIVKNSNHYNIYIIISSGSVSYDIYKHYLEKRMKNSLETPNIEVEIINETDHLFTLIDSQNLLLNKIYSYMKTMYPVNKPE